MNHRFTAIFAFLLIAAMASAKPQNATQDKSSDKSTTDKPQTTDKAQIVSTAEILKVDAKKQTLQVKNLANPSTTNPNNRAASGNPGGGRRPGGGGGSGGGVGFPGGGGGGRRRQGGGGYPYPGGGGGGGPRQAPQTAQAKEYKIYVTKDTQIKLANASLEFNDLHVGDRISVSGVPKGGGGDLEATAIIRDPQ